MKLNIYIILSAIGGGLFFAVLLYIFGLLPDTGGPLFYLVSLISSLIIGIYLWFRLTYNNRESRTLSGTEEYSGPAKYYCDCCGYITIKQKGWYEICPICHWEDNYVQGENYFLGGGPNSEPLYVAKITYEQNIGAKDAQFPRDPNYLTSEQVLTTKWDQLKAALTDDIETHYEDKEILDYFLDHLYKRDLSFSRELSELIFYKDKLRNYWVKVASLYFREFTDQKAREIRDYLLKECHNSWEELQELLNSLG